MNNDDHNSYLATSSLDVSINTQDKQYFNLLNLLNKNCRKLIIPSSHLLLNLQKLFNMNSEQDNSLNKDYLLDDTEKQTQSSSSCIRKRSREAIKRRNKIGHDKLKIRQKQFLMKRIIGINWIPKHVKHLLKQYNIKFVRLSEIYKHVLTILSHNPTDRDNADTLLLADIFDEEHFHQYFPFEH